MGADVLAPGGDVAAGAGKKRAGGEGGDIAWQNQLLLAGSALGPDHPHGRDGLGVGPGRDFLPAFRAIGDAGDGEADGADCENAKDNHDTVSFGGGGRFRGHGGSASGVRRKAGERLHSIGFFRRAPMGDREHRRHEQEGREGREQKAADDGASER